MQRVSIFQLPGIAGFFVSGLILKGQHVVAFHLGYSNGQVAEDTDDFPCGPKGAQTTLWYLLNALRSSECEERILQE